MNMTEYRYDVFLLIWLDVDRYHSLPFDNEYDAKMYAFTKKLVNYRIHKVKSIKKFDNLVNSEAKYK